MSAGTSDIEVFDRDARRGQSRRRSDLGSDDAGLLADRPRQCV